MPKKRSLLGRSVKDLVIAVGPSLVLLFVAGFVAYKYANPAPPRHFVISTGQEEGGYQDYAKRYAAILKKSGIDLEVRPSTGARENLNRLRDPKSGVDVAFVQDGLDSKEHDSTLVSLGALYYEPLWIFYRSPKPLTRLSDLKGKRVVVGERGGGAPALAWRMLKASGVEKANSTFLHLDYEGAEQALHDGSADAAFFLATPDEPFILQLCSDPVIRLMSLDQAEAIARQMPYLHHLVLPHGALDLAKNIPTTDVDLVSPTATLVARGHLHPALIDLLLQAATEVHSEPGIFERKGEFPIDKDYVFPVSGEAKRFYKSGVPFWQRYLPFWVATLIDRFILVAFPILALLLPLLKTVPKVLAWRVRSRIYQRYGELKYLETQMKAETDSKRFAEHLRQLDAIEDRVNHMKVPLDFSDHVYVLREHIEFVRGKLSRGLDGQPTSTALSV